MRDLWIEILTESANKDFLLEEKKISLHLQSPYCVNKDRRARANLRTLLRGLFCRREKS